MKIVEIEKLEKYFDLARKLTKPLKMKVTLKPIVIRSLLMVERSWENTGGIGNQRKSRSHPDSARIRK